MDFLQDQLTAIDAVLNSTADERTVQPMVLLLFTDRNLYGRFSYFNKYDFASLASYKNFIGELFELKVHSENEDWPSLESSVATLQPLVPALA